MKTQSNEFFNSVTALLFRHDPVGINFEDNTDEYEPEARTIVSRLPNCQSKADVCQVVYEEFVHWFGTSTAGTQERYNEIAADIWQLWCKTNIAQDSLS